MCGIFAFVGTRPDPTCLGAAAEAAGRRGPHGCGWATWNPTGIATAHHLGPIGTHLNTIRALSTPAVLGHARLATVGDPGDPNQLQPIRSGGHAIAHNGVIYNPDRLTPDTPTDSIALAHAYSRHRWDGMSPYTALEKIVATVDARAWAIVVLDSVGRLYAHRSYHPLWRHQGPGGTYLSSRRTTPDAELLPELVPVLI